MQTQNLLFKVNEPKKPTDRKAVRKAYENALQYISQIDDADAPEKS